MKRLLLLIIGCAFVECMVAKSIDGDWLPLKNDAESDTISFAESEIVADSVIISSNQPINNRETDLWSQINLTDSTAYSDIIYLCKTYMLEFPYGQYVTEVQEIERKAVAEQEADEQLWKQVLALNTIDGYASYLLQGTIHKDEAQAQKSALEAMERSWEETCRENSVNGYERFMTAYPQSKYLQDAKIRKKNAEDEMAWELAEKNHTIAAYEDYLASGSIHAAVARDRIDDLLWARCKKVDNIPAYEEYIMSDGKYVKNAHKRIADLERQQRLLISASAAYDSRDFVAAYNFAEEAIKIGGLNTNQMERARKYQEEYVFTLVDMKDATLSEVNDYLTTYGTVAPQKHLEKITKRKEKLDAAVVLETAKRNGTMPEHQYKYVFAEIKGSYGMQHKNYKNGDWMLGFSLGWQRKTVGGYFDYLFSMNTNDDGKFRAYDHLVSLGPSFRLVKENVTDIHFYMGPSLFYNHEIEAEKKAQNLMYGGNVGFRFSNRGKNSRRFGWWSVSLGINVVGSPYDKSVEWMPQIGLSIIPGAAAVTTMALLQNYGVLPMKNGEKTTK